MHLLFGTAGVGTRGNENLENTKVDSTGDVIMTQKRSCRVARPRSVDASKVKTACTLVVLEHILDLSSEFNFTLISKHFNITVPNTRHIHSEEKTTISCWFSNEGSLATFHHKRMFLNTSSRFTYRQAFFSN